MYCLVHQQEQEEKKKLNKINRIAILQCWLCQWLIFLSFNSHAALQLEQYKEITMKLWFTDLLFLFVF